MTACRSELVRQTFLRTHRAARLANKLAPTENRTAAKTKQICPNPRAAGIMSGIVKNNPDVPPQL
jgi:hypothetical protein